MTKVIITLNNIDIEQYCNLPAEEIITWFKTSSSLSDKNSLNIKHWKHHTALAVEDDENLEVLTEGEKYIVVGISSIVRVENIADESVFYLGNNDSFTTYKPLSVIAEVFKDHLFYMIHPNHLINIDHMKSFVKCNAFVTMSNSDAIPVSLGEDKSIIDFLNKRTII